MMETTGTLVVTVYTSGAKIPISGATVLVTQTTGSDRVKLLTVQSTDENGSTKPIQMETAGERASTRPFPQKDPCATCDIWGEKEGFLMLLVEGVEVFPNTVTVQPMELVPLAEGQSSLSRPSIQAITPQPL